MDWLEETIKQVSSEYGERSRFVEQLPTRLLKELLARLPSEMNCTTAHCKASEDCSWHDGFNVCIWEVKKALLSNEKERAE